jgi:hypothetical protein
MDTPIPLLAKVPDYDLQIHVGRSGLSLGDTVALTLDAQGRVIVTAKVRERVLGLFGRTRRRSLGHLGPVIDRLLAPLIANGQELRVRVVGITPEHLSTDDGPEVFVSVWGAPRHGPYRT